MRLPNARARRAPADAGASAIEYALVVAGMIVGLLAVAGGLRSAISTSYASAECEIGSISGCTSPTATGTGTSIVPTTTTTTLGTPVITLNSPTTSPEWGSVVTLTASIMPSTARGTVYFVEVTPSGDVAIGTGTLLNGGASITTSSLSLGTHTFRALYTGSVSVPEAYSDPFTITVVKRSSSTSLVVSPTTGPYGTSFTMTATVGPSDATGTVTFRDGTTSIGSGSLSGGQAQATVSTLSTGTHQITAEYSGDGVTNGSTSGSVAVSVTAAPTSLVLTATPSSTTSGTTVTLRATISPSAATGTIVFQRNGVTLGSATLSGGVATTTWAAVAGLHSMTASYAGNATYGPSSSNNVVVSVAPRLSTTALTASRTTMRTNQSVTLTARVTASPAAPIPTGTVTFLVGTVTIGTGTLNGSGVATLTTGFSTAGTRTVTARYNGDTETAASTSAGVTIVVTN